MNSTSYDAGPGQTADSGQTARVHPRGEAMPRATFELPHIYPIVDTDSLAQRGIVSGDAAQALIDGGARILQFRHKGA